MAKLFVKMDLDLAESEEVVLIAETTGDSIACTIGKLYLFWRWVERHCGASRGVTKMSRLVTLASVTGCDTRFLEALAEVDWLVTDGVTYTIPNWGKRFAHTARSGDTSAERQRRCRERKRAAKGEEACHGVTRDMGVTVTPRHTVTVTTELDEELDEDIELIPPNPPLRKVPFLIPLPAALNVPEFDAVWKRWMQYLVNRNHGRVAQDTLESQLREFAKLGVEKSVEVIEAAILKGHAGPVMPSDKFSGSRQPQPIPQLPE